MNSTHEQQKFIDLGLKTVGRSSAQFKQRMCNGMTDYARPMKEASIKVNQ